MEPRVKLQDSDVLGLNKAASDVANYASRLKDEDVWGLKSAVEETALQVGTGFVAQVASGVAGLAAAVADGVQAGSYVQQRVAGDLTYEPRTSGGKNLSAALYSASEPIGTAVRQASEYVGRTVQHLTDSEVFGGIAAATVVSASEMLPGKKPKVISGKDVTLDMFKTGEPVTVTGYHGTGKDFDKFSGVTYLSASHEEASGYAKQSKESVLHRSASAAEKRLNTAFTKPTPAVPKKFDLFRDSYPVPEDYAGEPGTFFTVDDAVYKAGEHGRHTLVAGVKVVDKDNGVQEVVHGVSDVEKSIRADIQDAVNNRPASKPKVVEAEVTLNNPYVTHDDLYANMFADRWSSDTKALAVKERERLQSLGYDGVISVSDAERMANSLGLGSGRDVVNYVVFNPDTIKIKSKGDIK